MMLISLEGSENSLRAELVCPGDSGNKRKKKTLPHSLVYTCLHVICILISLIKCLSSFISRTMASFLLFIIVFWATTRCWNIDFRPSRYLVGSFAFVKTLPCPLLLCVSVLVPRSPWHAKNPPPHKHTS